MYMNKVLGASLMGLSLIMGTIFADQTNKKGKPVEEKKHLAKSGEVKPVAEDRVAEKEIVEEGTSVDLKIRFVNSMELMRDTEEGQKISRELQEKYKELAEEIQELNRNLETAAAEFKKKESMLSESAKEAEQKKLMKMKRELEVKAQEAEEEYKLAAQKATERISKEIIDVVEDIAKADDLDAVIDKDSGRALYVKDTTANYTDKVKISMNKKYGAKAQPAKKTA